MDRLKNRDPTICCLWETHLSYKDKHRLKVKRWKTIPKANGIERKVTIAIFISDKKRFQDLKKGNENHTT